MKFIVCLTFFTTVGFTSGQSTQEVRAHSGYTQDGQCSYTFVLPPSSVQQCGSGQGEVELQQIREQARAFIMVTRAYVRISLTLLSFLDNIQWLALQMRDLQSNYQELRQQNDVLEQRLSALEKNTKNTTQPDLGDENNIPSSCAEVAQRSGFNNESFYVIDPDGPDRGVLPMVVQCDVVEGTAITLIGHNSEARTRVKVTGYEDPAAGTYSKNVTCWDSIEQVRAVVNQSSLCKQHIKSYSDKPVSWWVTWDGRQADYWGGASPGSGKCACGQSGTCTGRCISPTGTCSGRCNCDANDGRTWSEDSGFLSHKDDLPVTQLRFGDTNDWDEEGYHTLGKLICYP
ncbi:CNTNAP4 [Branchiostoma lanceolatum]|uniref:CNTNAP4 protein n=1 Tax=Branchiostoma lanceolatum TaxID=7740 RepID=A0A8J9YZ84_BRALA|nr:CNTNAP4 [Branchiostoma lanceolatum]